MSEWITGMCSFLSFCSCWFSFVLRIIPVACLMLSALPLSQANPQPWNVLGLFLFFKDGLMQPTLASDSLSLCFYLPSAGFIGTCSHFCLTTESSLAFPHPSFLVLITAELSRHVTTSEALVKSTMR